MVMKLEEKKCRRARRQIERMIKRIRKKDKE